MMPKTQEKLSFKDFINSDEKIISPSNPSLVISPSKLSKESVLATQTGISLLYLFKGNTSKTEKFAAMITDDLNSPESEDKISDAIGTPKEYETEEEFVTRAKQNLTEYLMAKFCK